MGENRYPFTTYMPCILSGVCIMCTYAMFNVLRVCVRTRYLFVNIRRQQASAHLCAKAAAL